MIKLFTHTDLDGVGCAILAQLAFGKDNVDISYCNYDDIDQIILDYVLKNFDDVSTTIYITDISTNEEIADLLNKRGNVRLFDHHSTALWLNKYKWCTVSVDESDGTKTSGTMILYQWLMLNDNYNKKLKTNKSLYNFVDLVRNYDTWRWKELGEDGVICKQVNDLLYLYGRDSFINLCISEIHDEVFPRLYKEDKFILQVRQSEIDKYIEEKNKTMIINVNGLCGKVCGFVFADRFISELGNRLCEMNPGIDFVAIINIDNRTVSYRTIKENINLGEDVAALFGGGGHSKAAGSQFTDKIKLNVIKNIFGINI